MKVKEERESTRKKEIWRIKWGCLFFHLFYTRRLPATNPIPETGYSSCTGCTSVFSGTTQCTKYDYRNRQFIYGLVLIQYVWVIDQVWAQDGWILAKFFFCVFMDRDEVEVHKLAKKRMRPISSHLDRTNLVNKGFIIWLLVKFCLRDTAGSPEWARWLHLAR